MNAFDLRNRLVDDYLRYTRSFIHIQDARIERLVDEALTNGVFWPEPLVQLNPTFSPGGTIDELVDRGVLDERCRQIFRIGKSAEDLVGHPLELHEHQRAAILKAKSDQSYVLTSGTGSGKSLTYIVPIVDHVLRRGTGRGVQAIIVYPMNALANSQDEELKKFLNFGAGSGGPPVRVARYTGQEQGEERAALRDDPPDVLLTNYMMLELLLMRHEDRRIVAAAQGLKFLVFDELHTYRGRQGADVAMLIRRCRDAFHARDLICIGTSATMASGGNSQEQRAVVAGVAEKLFGIPFSVEQVIHESLLRATPEVDVTDRGLLGRIAESIRGGGDPPSDAGVFSSHPLASWIESTFGVRAERDTGRLVRQAPRRLRGDALEGRVSAAGELAAATGIAEVDCARAIEAYLLAGSRLKKNPASRYPIFAFRLHQFLTRGDTVWATIESQEVRHLELRKQVSRPGHPEATLFPLTFCRSCGTPYYRVSVQKDADGVFLMPREDRRGSPDDGEEGYLYVSDRHPWPRARSGSVVLARLPSTMKETARDGSERLSKDAQGDVPEPVTVEVSGRVHATGAGTDGALIRGAFHFCLNPECGVTYAKTQRSERAKLVTLGVDSRSTATTILAVRTLLELRSDSSLKKVARKLLSFTDNRQDASLQAGHFNDFVHVAQLRSALFEAVRDRGVNGLRHRELTEAVFTALGLDFATYASNPALRAAARGDTNEALMTMIRHHLYRDLQGNWRVTAPNLEDCGLLRFEYRHVTGPDGVLADEGIWASGIEDEFDRGKKRFVPVPALLAAASHEVRAEVIHTLADAMRRALCVKVDVLDASRQQDMVSQVQLRLAEGTPWYPEDVDDLVQAQVAFPRPKRERERSGFFISGYGSFGRYLKRRLSNAAPGVNVSRDELSGIVEYLMLALSQYGVVEPVRSGKTPEDRGYQLNADVLVWLVDDGTVRRNDPLRVLSGGAIPMTANPYFVATYRGFADLRQTLEAREHTAQVPQEARLEREARFREADLPLLFCSPTMELGVDIAELNVVNLRNVPPTPANYAQRSGRAGRSGQQALVFTYCAGRSPHDQFFFREPIRMVAGSVTAPRIDLRNRDLIRSHVQGIWLQRSATSLGRSLAEIIDLTPTNGSLPLPLKDGVLQDLRNVHYRAEAKRIAHEVLAGLESDLRSTTWWHAGWVDDVLDRIERTFEQACDRWRSLYRSAVRQQALHNKILLDPNRSAEHRESRDLRAQAESQIRLLTDAQGAIEGDFYPYRYLAGEGFLPGYNFPRLPLSAYVPARRKREDRNTFLSRPRFLAINEFGPQAIIYHEGARYRVYKANLDRASDSIEDARQLATVTMKRCSRCGYAHLPTDGGAAVNNCDRCGHAFDGDAIIPNLTQLQNVSVRLVQRINSDEEERQQMGYRLVTSYRFPEIGGKVERFDADARVGDRTVIELLYGDATDIYRINLGWAKRKATEPHGFDLDLDRGYWARNSVEPADKDDPAVTLRRSQRVVPFVRDTKNVLVMRFVDALSIEEMAALQAAFKEAIQRQYQIEPRELACEPMPHASDRRELLFYEASEGGAGVLRQLVEEPHAIARLARIALEVCHFDPDSLADLAGERCGAACYECLLDYANQPDHQRLDRKHVRSLLALLRDATVHASGGVGRREARFEHLSLPADSRLERRWLDRVRMLGLRAPTHAQYRVPNLFTDADFFYAQENVVIYVDGPPHDVEPQVSKDAVITEKLLEAGYGVIRFHHQVDWDELFRGHPDVFGVMPS